MNVVKMYSRRDASARLARRRLGRISGGSWIRRSGDGIRRSRGRRRILQRQVSAAESGVLCSGCDDNRLHGVASALQLRQSSPYRFKLSGQRQSAGGGRDAISIERLPTAAPAPVWPADGTDLLAGRSEIYVYV